MSRADIIGPTYTSQRACPWFNTLLLASRNSNFLNKGPCICILFWILQSMYLVLGTGQVLRGQDVETLLEECWLRCVWRPLESDLQRTGGETSVSGVAGCSPKAGVFLGGSSFSGLTLASAALFRPCHKPAIFIALLEQLSHLRGKAKSFQWSPGSNLTLHY